MLSLELLSVVLGLALLAALAWALALRRRLRPQPPADPRPDPIKPLFDAATSAIDAGLLIVDADRRVQYLNPQAVELLGSGGALRPGERLIGALRDYQVDALAAEVLDDGEARELVIQQPAAGRMLRLRATRFAGVEGYGLALLVRDVTQLSMLERARRDLVANVSHELRTPLASVKLLVETLQSEPPAPIAQRMLGQMAHEVDAIAQLVDELHELAQIESGRVALQLRADDLGAVVSRAVERIRPQCERKSLALEAQLAPDLPPALIDSGRVGQVLLNLLHNAAKFSGEGGRIVVAARLSDGAALPAGHPPGAFALLSVSDSGIGIPAHELPRIFERFYKVDRARTRNAGGTGLGLAIAKHLVEGHGGRIWATSREGHGSTFFLTLPLA